jgi:hypothetical protein
MAMGSDICASNHHVQKPMRVVIHAQMKVVIGTQPRGAVRPLDQGLEEL